MPDFNADIKSCRYCGKIIKKEDVICGFCGYNFQTGTITVSRQRSSEENKKEVKAKNKIPNSVKSIIVTVILFISLVFLINRLFFGKTNIDNLISNIMQGLGRLKPTATQKANPAYINKKTTGVAGLFKKVFPEKTIEEKRKTSLTVEGIAFDPKTKSLATINGQVVCEGDNIGNIKVNKINEDSVELVVNGEDKTLKISQSIPLAAK